MWYSFLFPTLKAFPSQHPLPPSLFSHTLMYTLVKASKPLHQGCALEVPGGLWRLTFVLGWLEILVFAYKSYAGHPGFYRFRALGSLQFFLELSSVYSKKIECQSTHYFSLLAAG